MANEFYMDSGTYNSLAANRFKDEADEKWKAQMDAIKLPAPPPAPKMPFESMFSDFTKQLDEITPQHEVNAPLSPEPTKSPLEDMWGNFQANLDKIKPAAQTIGRGMEQTQLMQDFGTVPGATGALEMVKEQARGSLAGQVVAPYNPEERQQRIDRPGLQGMVDQFKKSGMSDEEAQRMALGGFNLAMGIAGQPMNVAGKAGTAAAKAAAEVELRSTFGRAIERDVQQGNIAPSSLRPKQAALREEVAGAPPVESPRPPTSVGATDNLPVPSYGGLVKPREAASGGVPPTPPRPPALEPGMTPPRDPNAILDEMYAPKPSGVRSLDFGKMKDNLILRWVNQNMPLERIEEMAAKVKAQTGDTLAADEMAATLNRMNASGTAERNLVQNYAPILQDLADRRTTNVARNFLTFRQNIDTAAALGNPNRKFSGGLSAAESQQGLVDLSSRLGPETYMQLEADAGRIADFTRTIWDRKLQSGVIDQAFHDAMVERYPYYTPTKILDYMRDPDNLAAGDRINIESPQVKKYTLEGTERARQDPLHAIVNYAYQTEQLAKKNEVFNAFLKEREIIPGARETFKEMPPGYKPTKDEITISGFVDGEKKTLAVPKDVQYAFERITHDPNAALQWGMTLYKAMITSRNPVFLASNALNDFGSYTVRATSREGGPTAIPRVTVALAKAYFDAFQGLGTARFGPKTEQFLKEGGAQFGFFQRSEENARKSVVELARRNAFVVKDKSDYLRLMKSLLTLEPVEAIGKRIELAPRVAMTELARTRGKNWTEAVKEGRSVTMDFAVGGDLSKLVNQFVPFFNVGIQAPAQVVRAYRENPRAFTATVAALLVAPTSAAEAWNRSNTQREKDYEDVPDYLKAGGIVIMVPNATYMDAQGNAHPQFIYIPTREFSPFVVWARQIASATIGRNTRDWKQLLGDTMKSVVPVQGEGIGEAASQIVPPGLSTIGQLYMNKDPFTGAMIATERKNTQASPAAQAISAGMGAVAKATGLGSTPQPSQVEWGIRDLTGGVGGAALAGSKLATGAPETQNAGPGATPFIGGVVGKFLKGSIGQRLEESQQKVMAEDVKQTLSDYGITTAYGPVGRTAKGIELTTSEQERYQSLANERVDEFVRELLASPEWQDYGIETRAKVLDRVIGKARQAALVDVLETISDEEFGRRKEKSAA